MCTNSKNGRMLWVSVNQKEIVEHPFGYTYFLLKGIEKGKGEFSLMCFVYNLKRVLNIVGINKLMEAIK